MIGFEVSIRTDDPEYIRVLWNVSNFLVRRNKYLVIAPTLFARLHYCVKWRSVKRFPLINTYSFSDEVCNLKFSGNVISLCFEDMYKYFFEKSFVLLYFKIFPRISVLSKQKDYMVILPQSLLTTEQRNKLVEILDTHLTN